MGLISKMVVLVLMVSISACITSEEKPTETALIISPEEPSETVLPAATHAAGLATGQPGMNTYPRDNPGKTTKLERPYDGAPPLIPHNVVEFDITRSNNDCLYCHLTGLELGEGHVATKIPLSHYIDEFTGEQKDEIVGIRYNCLQCHVPQSEEEHALITVSD